MIGRDPEASSGLALVSMLARFLGPGGDLSARLTSGAQVKIQPATACVAELSPPPSRDPRPTLVGGDYAD